MAQHTESEEREGKTKPKEQMEMERAAEELERKIIRFTNIDKESFTHSFRGISTTVKPGASQIMRFPEADHLATHLARKMLSREKKQKLGTSDPKGVALWTEKEVADLKVTILTDVEQETAARPRTEKERHDADLERLNREGGGSEKKPAPPITKKDVIKELEKRGQKVDETKTLEELVAQLMELEAAGQ